jgi:hypothetical protein
MLGNDSPAIHENRVCTPKPKLRKQREIRAIRMETPAATVLETGHAN